MKPGWYIIGVKAEDSHQEIVREALDKDVTAIEALSLNRNKDNNILFPSPISNVVYVYHNGKRFTQYLFTTGAMVKDGVEGTTLAVFDIPEKEEVTDV